MNAADRIYLAGFNAALDMAERAGARILAGSLPTLRREHAAAGLLAFVDEARLAMASEGNTVVSIPLPNATHGSPLPPVRRVQDVGPSAVVSLDGSITQLGSSKPDRATARAQGYSGDCCDSCGSLSMKRSGSCLVCEACGTTSGCS